MMNVCLGGLQAISGEYYEAAKMDGASKFQCFKSITLPMVTKLSIPLVISSFAANFNNFGNIYMITQGGRREWITSLRVIRISLLVPPIR